MIMQLQSFFMHNINLIPFTKSRILDPLFQLKRLLGLGGRERRIAKLKKVLRHEVKNIVHNRKNSGDKEGYDILGRIIHQDKIHHTLSEDELCDFVMNILIAGIVCKKKDFRFLIIKFSYLYILLFIHRA